MAQYQFSFPDRLLQPIHYTVFLAVTVLGILMPFLSYGNTPSESAEDPILQKPEITCHRFYKKDKPIEKAIGFYSQLTKEFVTIPFSTLKRYEFRGKHYHIPVGYTWPSNCLLYTSPSPRDKTVSRMPSSA